MSLSCVRLPDVLEAYDGTGSYTKDQRHLLVKHLQDPEQRKHPWPAKLDVAFGIEDPDEVTAREDKEAKEAQDAKAAAGEGDVTKEGGSGAAGASTSACNGAETASSPRGASGARGGGGAGRGAARGGKSSGKARRRSGGRRGGSGEGTDDAVLLGSPMLDATLEDTAGLREVIETLKQETGLSDGTGSGLKMEVCMHAQSRVGWYMSYM